MNKAIPPVLFALCAALALSPLTAARPDTVSRDFMTTSFDRVYIDGNISAKLTHNANAKITAQGAAADLDQVQVVRNGRSLRLSMRQSDGLYRRSGPVTLALQSADVRAVTLNGNAALSIDRLDKQTIGLSVFGTGSLSVGSLTADKMSLRVVGNGSVAIAGGTVNKAEFLLDGAATLAAEGLSAGRVIVNSAGPTRITAFAREDAEVRANGAGAITINGKGLCRILYAPQASIECGGGYSERATGY